MGLRWIPIALLLMCSMLPLGGCSDTRDDRLRADEPKKNTSQLRIDEAKAIVTLYEIQLRNVHARASQEDLKSANVRETYEKAKKSYSEGALSEKALRETKENYDWWVLQDNIQDVQEAEAKLELAKIRLAMVEAGMEVYRGALP